MTSPDDKYPSIHFTEQLLPAFAALRERVVVYETQTNARFNNGAEAFVRVSEQLEEAKEMASDSLKAASAANAAALAAAQPKPVQWSKVVPIVLAIITTGSGVIWALAKNPDRAEFDSSIGKIQNQLEDAKLEATKVGAEQIRLRGTLENQQLWLNHINAKLDKALEPTKRGGR